MVNIQKCAIIGCGFVGATTAYSLTQSALFSEIVLIDINHKKVEGEAADLNHGLPFLSPMEIYAGDYCDISDAAIVIITAGANQNDGETRLDLVKRNAEVFESIIQKVIKYNRECILLVVTNPVDILTYVSAKISGFPESRVIGSGTVLDTARLKYLLGRQLDVDYRNIHAFIIGEHGDSELPVWSGANVSGIDLKHFCQAYHPLTKEHLEQLFQSVKTSAYRIISAKGATYYAIAESVRKIVSSIVKDENTILPVSTVVNGHYGIDRIALSLPCIVGREGIRKILEIPLDEQERARLNESAKKLKEVAESLTCLSDTCASSLL